jgi:hypothetical protein
LKGEFLSLLRGIFSVDALRHWEQGLLQPEGLTRPYLLVIETRAEGSPESLAGSSCAIALGVNGAAGGMPSYAPKWRATTDDDEHYVYATAKNVGAPTFVLL